MLIAVYFKFLFFITEKAPNPWSFSHRIGASFRIHLLILILQYFSVIILLVISYFPASALSASGSMGIISADLSAPRDIHLANVLIISLSRIKRADF